MMRPLRFLPSGHDLVDVGAAVGLGGEDVEVAGSAAPHVGVGVGDHDAGRVGPVVVQPFPHPAGAFGDVGVGGAAVVHLQVLVLAVGEDGGPGPGRSRSTGQELLRGGGGGLVQVKGGHCRLLDSGCSVDSHHRRAVRARSRP
jgi:hypothetical protein